MIRAKAPPLPVIFNSFRLSFLCCLIGLSGKYPNTKKSVTGHNYGQQFCKGMIIAGRRKFIDPH
jgi:hypothetical protein